METSAYVLLYAVGSSYLVSHGNCEPLSSGGHNGVKKFGCDFDMAIGTLTQVVEEFKRDLIDLVAPLLRRG